MRFPMFRVVRRATIVAAFLTSSMVAATVRAESGVTDYVVKDGDSCLSIAIHQLGNRAELSTLHRLNPQLGPLPHHLVAGQILHLPMVVAPAASNEPDAKLTRSRGSVEVRKPTESAWDAAKRGMDLYRAWRVGSREQASAELTFHDDSRLFMRENTVVIVYGPTEHFDRTLGADAELERGTLEGRLAELRGGKPVVVRTPSSEATLGVGTSLIAVADSGDSIIGNHGGADLFLRAVDKLRHPVGGKVVVKNGMGSRVRVGKAPEKPRPLPLAPEWTSASGRFIALPGVTTVVTGGWSAVAKAATYRISVVNSTDDEVASVQVPANASSFEFRDLPVGAYRASISVIDGDGFESKRSVPWPFEIVAVAITPPGATGAMVAPSTNAAVASLPQGTDIASPSGLRCALGDGATSDHVVLTSVGDAELRCSSDTGATATLRLVVTALTVNLAPLSGPPIPRHATTPLPLAFDHSNAPGATTAALAVQATGGTATLAPASAPSTNIEQLNVLVTPDDKSTGPVHVDIVLASAPTTILASLDVPVATAAPIVKPPAKAPSQWRSEAGLFLGYHGYASGNTAGNELGNALDSNFLVGGGFELGLRYALWPWSRVGFEAEAAFIPTTYTGSSDRANVLGLRAQAVVRIVSVGRFSVRGLLGVGSETLFVDETTAAHVNGPHTDTDTESQVGVSLTFRLSRDFDLRLDGRDVISPNRSSGFANQPEINLGVSTRFGQ